MRIMVKQTVHTRFMLMISTNTYHTEVMQVCRTNVTKRGNKIFGLATDRLQKYSHHQDAQVCGQLRNHEEVRGVTFFGVEILDFWSNSAPKPVSRNRQRTK
jgi:hypothetical protein